jgi:hypothetical protein
MITAIGTVTTARAALEAAMRNCTALDGDDTSCVAAARVDWSSARHQLDRASGGATADEPACGGAPS